MNTVDHAIALAITTHHGHANQHDGEPYLLHVQRVAVAVRDAGWSDVFVATAWLHDAHEDFPALLPLTLIEQTLATVNEVHASTITTAVEAISKRPGEDITDYLNRCKRNPVAHVVKCFDRDDNFRRLHLVDDDAKRARMSRKYSLSLSILGPSRYAT